jgi:hypothetical protein
VRESPPGSFELSFLLPRGVAAAWADGRFYFGLGCRVRVISPLVEIAGPSREAVFECASNVLRESWEEGWGPISIAATLVSPPPVSGSDSWSIIVGADVAFSPTSLDPHFPHQVRA